MKKSLKRVLALGTLVTVAACGANAASHSTHSTHSSAAKPLRVVVGRAHVTGSGEDRWFLRLRGVKQPVTVSKKTAGRCHIGDPWPHCADRPRG